MWFPLGSSLIGSPLGCLVIASSGDLVSPTILWVSNLQNQIALLPLCYQIVTLDEFDGKLSEKTHTVGPCFKYNWILFCVSLEVVELVQSLSFLLKLKIEI